MLLARTASLREVLPVRLRSLIASGVFAAVVLWPLSAASQFYPGRLDGTQLGAAPYASTGYVSTVIGRSGYSGSGAVVRDGRLLYTCAHVLFDRGRWATRVGFHRAYHSEFEPNEANAVVARGFHYVSGYAGRESYPYDFDRDFAVAYSWPGQVFGEPLGYFEDGAAAVRSSVGKLILGYPAYLDFNDADGYYYQHVTGPFTATFNQLEGPWYEVANVTTGPGNSGGPVLVESGGSYLLAGVLVSGSSLDAGIYVLDSAAGLAAANALQSAEQPIETLSALGSFTRSVSSNKAKDLRDGSNRYISRNFSVPGSRAGRDLTSVFLDLNVSAERRGDLDIYVRSPRGRTHVIATANPSDAGSDLAVRDRDISSSFIGTTPRGSWKIFLRDAYPGNFSRFNSATLRVSSQ